MQAVSSTSCDAGDGNVAVHADGISHSTSAGDASVTSTLPSYDGSFNAQHVLSPSGASFMGMPDANRGIASDPSNLQVVVKEFQAAGAAANLLGDALCGAHAACNAIGQEDSAMLALVRNCLEAATSCLLHAATYEARMCVVSAVPMPAPNLGIRMRGMRACQAAAEPSMALCRGLTPISKA